MRVETLNEILEKVKWAPSGDNCQPWKFQWDGSELSVWNIYELGRHAYNQEETATFVALGGLLEYIRIASLEKGFSIDVNLVDSNFSEKSDAILAKINFSESERQEDTLEKWLIKRCADRRRFKGGKLSEGLMKTIQEDVESFTSAKAYIVSPIKRKLIETLSTSEKILWAWGQAHRDLLKWVRFSAKEARETKSGLPWRNLGINFNDMLMLKLIRRYPGLVKKIKPILNQVAVGTAKKQIESSSAMIFFTVLNNDKKSLIQLGQLAIRIWLRLNSQGFGVQPMSSGVLFPYYQKQFGLVPEATSVMGSHFEATTEQLKESLKLQDDEQPVWSFRTGLSSDLPDSMRTFRRSLELVLTN